MPQPKRFLEDVAQLCDDRRISVTGTQRLLRRGPFRLFVETGTIPFDDFMFDGRFLVLGSVCNVMSVEGTLSVMRAYDKCAVTELYHVIRPRDERDSEYLYHILSATPAHAHADISGQTQRLTTQSLRHISVPWPEAKVRAAYVRCLEECQTAREDALRERRELFEQGVALYGAQAQTAATEILLSEACSIVEGRALDASLRGERGRFPVVSSQGVFAYTDEPGISQPCVVVGQAGQYLLSYLMPDGAFPLSDTVALVADGDAPLDLAYWALYAQGVRSQLRVVDHEIDAFRETIDSIAALPISVGSRGRWAVFQKESASILKKIAALDGQMEESRQFVKTLSSRLLNGDASVARDLEPWLDSCPSQPEDHRDNAPLVPPVRPSATDEGIAALIQSVLVRLRSAGDVEATSFDAAWEVTPYVFLRSVCSDQEWDGLADGPNQAEAMDKLLDECAVRVPELEFLRHFECASSALGDGARSEIVGAIGEIPRSELSGNRLRSLALEYAVEGERRGSTWVERRIDAPCPPAVSALLARLSSCFAPEASTLYDPHARTDQIVAAVARTLPLEEMRADTPRYVDTLAATMAWHCDGLSGTLIQHETRDALRDPADQGSRSDLVVSLLPSNGGEWTDRRPDPSDSRWAFGEPPRNKANLAWLQHAYSCRRAGGYAILGLSDAVLHEGRGCEPSVRAQLIASGCVRVVLALPGRLFEDDRPPLCLMVLGDPRDPGDDAETLLVNALNEGVELAEGDGIGRRTLPDEAVERIAGVVESWHARVGYADCKGFCQSVGREALAAHGDLTPWSFV